MGAGVGGGGGGGGEQARNYQVMRKRYEQDDK